MSRAENVHPIRSIPNDVGVFTLTQVTEQMYIIRFSFNDEEGTREYWKQINLEAVQRCQSVEDYCTQLEDLKIFDVAILFGFNPIELHHD